MKPEGNVDKENGKEEIPLDTEVVRQKTQYDSQMMKNPFVIAFII